MTDTVNMGFLEHTASVASAFVRKNGIQPDELPQLIHDIYAAFYGHAQPQAVAVPAEAPKPAVNPAKSVHDDFIICLENGKEFKSLKRHLATHYDLTPDQYRAKWGLPGDYPMVAPAYAARRSRLAKNMGLGRKPGKAKK
jgi:predicted transcriptional regulator